MTDESNQDLAASDAEEAELFLGSALGKLGAVAAVSLLLPQGERSFLPLVRIAIKTSGVGSSFAFAGSWPEILGFIEHVSEDMANQVDRLKTLHQKELLNFDPDDVRSSLAVVDSIAINLTKILGFLNSLPVPEAKNLDVSKD